MVASHQVRTRDGAASVKDAASVEDMLAALAGVDLRRLSSGEVAAIDRRLRRLAPTPDVRIAYQGNHTIEPLPSFVGVCCACNGVVAASWTGEFNQHVQEVLRADSGLIAFDPHLVLLALDLRELAPRVCHDFASLDAAEKRAEIDAIVAHLMAWAEAAASATRASLLIANFPSPGHLQAGIADLKSDFGEREFFARLNLALLHAFRDSTRVHVLDLDRVASRVGTGRAFSATTYYLARMPWDLRLLPDLADEIYRHIHALLGRTRKCLVLDLDNTLWGGIVGEDGPDGVEIGPGTPRSEAFAAFQRALLALKHRGIVLAVASKNNPDDVREVFRTRRMPLQEDDFAAFQVGWDNKHESLERIADELNIGVDSLVFVDDSPAECEIVRQMLPMVEVIQLPSDPADYADLLRRQCAFETLHVTGEDRIKSRQYVESRRRREHLTTATSLEAYLESLETVVTIRKATAKEASRLHQLFMKTNQFNLTTRRYGSADVDRFIAEPCFDLRAMDVRDRFGDLGTVGLVLVDLRPEEPTLDSFIMSCRAMGREVESALMNRIKTDYLLDGSHAALIGLYVPTRKNAPVTEFYQRQGFELLEETASGARRYRLSRAQCRLRDCHQITVTQEQQ